ncbi:MAG: hypothetical protein K5836_01620 [Clostridiales bacterium]|nr:hypothetical protein [Clostridiales bacterium]
MSDFKNNYPLLIIHGFAGWGNDDGLNKYVVHFGMFGSRRLEPYLVKKGYEVYFPSLGPFCSAWDRACEIYAYLLGGTVDYGKVHSEKYNHKRYGRTYPGVLPDLGKTEAHKKVSLYGHSFGGPTVKAFVELMNNGCKEEIEGTPEDELSPLFKGGQSHLIHCAVTLSGVNNGTILDQCFDDKSMHATEKIVLKATSALGYSPYNWFFDLGQQHFGLGRYPEENAKEIVKLSKEDWEKGYAAYTSSKLDRSNWEMDIIWSKWMNDHQGVAKDVYYFAERACNSHPDENGFAVPNTFFPITYFTGKIIGKKQPVRETGYEYGPEWYPNDGFVPVIGQSAPLNQPSIEAGPATDFRPGIWYNMPVRNGDHVLWNGMSGNKWVFFKIWDEMLERAKSLPDAEDVI